ncbi:EpsG family protein [Xenorhabdus lircayensis]|uniref:EpsG family protein n=1 Tax=Xenorhabdus lircayensis TaxID=2763499 RepID=A0ABS0U2C3_9GAMM|nr:EpsG family protein [Xenorhabdus lircayensis]MBI6548022.1 EpsG family protein [Xenorhabdus lircayensis]
MSLYSVSFLYIPLLLLIFSSERQERFIKSTLLLFYSIFVFSYINSGPDHIVYQWIYENEPLEPKFEIIYTYISYISNLLNFNYHQFLIVNKVINIIILGTAIFYLDKHKLLFFMGMYIPTSFITFELNLLRQSLALHFGLLFIIFFMKKKKLKSYIYIVFSILSHTTSLLTAFIFIKKTNKNALLLLVLILGLSLYLNFPYIINKFLEYKKAGAINIRPSILSLQTLILLLVPFFFFSVKKDKITIFMYFFICLSSIIPLMIRIYPIALLLLLPVINKPRAKNPKLIMVFFITFSISFTLGKTYLLLQTDRQSIKEGIYTRGYE